MSRKHLIITGANTAREINYLGKEPPAYFTDPDIMFISKLNRDAWQAVESSLKEYRIKNKANPNNSFEAAYFPVNGIPVHIKIGTKVEADCNEETLEAIIL